MNKAEIKIYSSKEHDELTGADSLEMILSEDYSYLKVITKCYEGAKENENLILIEKNSETEKLFIILQKVLEEV